MADYPRVELQNIDKLGLSFKKGVAKVSFEVTAPGPDILKLVYLQATGQALNVVIESPQAVMDLQIKEVNIKTGEVVNG